MNAVPQLLDLAIAAFVDHVNGSLDDSLLFSICKLPDELFDVVLMRLTPLALKKFGDIWSFFIQVNENILDADQKRCRMRQAWHRLYANHWKWENSLMCRDLQQAYWERHLQECVDIIVEANLLASIDDSIDGLISDANIPESILEKSGFTKRVAESIPGCSKFSFHCMEFGSYLRHLKLPNQIIAQTFDLIQCSQLESLEIRWVQPSHNVEGLCKLLAHNKGSLKTVHFVLCKLSSSSINAICDSLQMKDSQEHRLEHIVIKKSNIIQHASSHLPSSFTSLLTSQRQLLSLSLSDSEVGRNFAIQTWKCLVDAQSSFSELNLSENDISGFFTRLKWRSSSTNHSMTMPKLPLRVLNLRGCNLKKYDIHCMKHALLHLPNLQNLDLSDNRVASGIRVLIFYFTEISKRDLPFLELKLENCGLNCPKVIELLDVLSTMKPLNLLSLKRNKLGGTFGPSLGKYLCTGVGKVDVERVSLNSSGFAMATMELTKELDIEYINIKHNRGAVQAAQFLSAVVSHAKHKTVECVS